MNVASRCPQPTDTECEEERPLRNWVTSCWSWVAISYRIGRCRVFEIKEPLLGMSTTGIYPPPPIR